MSWIFGMWWHLQWLHIPGDSQGSDQGFVGLEKLPIPWIFGIVPPQPDHSTPDLHQEKIRDYPIPTPSFGSRDFAAGRRKFRNPGLSQKSSGAGRKTRFLWMDEIPNGNSLGCQEMPGFPFPPCFPSEFPSLWIEFPNWCRSEAVLNHWLENPKFLWIFPASQIHSLKVSRTQPAAGLGDGKDLPRSSFPSLWNDDFRSFLTKSLKLHSNRSTLSRPKIPYFSFWNKEGRNFSFWKSNFFFVGNVPY